jgi:copper homeostasis protein
MPDKNITLEVCANSVTSALAAQSGGALRVELCENLHEGGTTPSRGSIAVARKLLNIKLYVLIRPRGGDFLYSDLEFNIMKIDINNCISTQCDGIVIGILNEDGSVDKERCKELIDIAKQGGLGVTFHRAFDRCNDQFKALEDIIALGCERILTSGNKSTAIEGSRRLAELVEKAAGRISIMPGAGINEHNVTDLVNFTGVAEVHSSARSLMASKMIYTNNNIIPNNNYVDEYTIDVTSAKRVKAIIKNANS